MTTFVLLIVVLHLIMTPAVCEAQIPNTDTSGDD